jgi:8-oxo-dGTP diphosphatase
MSIPAIRLPQLARQRPCIDNQPMDNDKREYPSNPIAAVGTIVLRDGKVLLIMRTKEPGAGKWSIPGGKIELGETLFEAAEREVLEETGISVKIDKVVNNYDSIIRDERGEIKYHYFLVYCTAGYIEGEPQISDESSEVVWTDIDDVDGLDMNPVLKNIIHDAVDGQRQATGP